MQIKIPFFLFHNLICNKQKKRHKIRPGKKHRVGEGCWFRGDFLSPARENPLALYPIFLPRGRLFYSIISLDWEIDIW